MTKKINPQYGSAKNPVTQEDIERFQQDRRNAARRRDHLRATYGISEKDYEAIWKSQRGVCAICGGTSNGRKLAVDHNHENGAVRGLLCDSCNMGLGLFKDSVRLLAEAIAYLEDFR